MLTVRNKRTGITGTYPKRQAEWLISTGRCELHEPAKAESKPAPVEKPAAKPKKADKAVKKSPEAKVIQADKEDVAIQEATESTE